MAYVVILVVSILAMTIFTLITRPDPHHSFSLELFASLRDEASIELARKIPQDVKRRAAS